MSDSPQSSIGTATPTATAARPAVSVVIPTLGRLRSLTTCLEALCAQTLSRDAFEVIVCDDASPEPVAPAITAFAGRLTLKVVRKKHGGPAAARNEGARHADAQYLAFTDDDCVPEPEWLELLVGRFERHPGHLIGGSIVNLLPDDPCATATQLIMSCVYEYYARHETGRRLYSTTNFAVPTSRFWLLDGFSERFAHAAGEDYDFCARWFEAGFPNVYAPEVEVGHAHGHTLPTFWMQHFGYGRALLRVREGMARRVGRGGIQLESPRFYRDILTYALRTGSGWRAVQEAALVMLSQVATVSGAFRELIAPDEGWRAKVLSPQHSPSTTSAIP